VAGLFTLNLCGGSVGMVPAGGCLGHAAVPGGWGDFFRGHSRLVTNFGGPSEELDGSFDLRLCARRWKHQQSHDKSDNYSESNLEKPSNRGLGGPVVDFNQNDD
jgi:hypothetical protein